MKYIKQFSGNSDVAFRKAEDSNFMVCDHSELGEGIKIIAFPNSPTVRRSGVKQTIFSFSKTEAEKLIKELSNILLANQTTVEHSSMPLSIKKETNY